MRVLMRSRDPVAAAAIRPRGGSGQGCGAVPRCQGRLLGRPRPARHPADRGCPRSARVGRRRCRGGPQPTRRGRGGGRSRRRPRPRSATGR
jgi:hypothetical protein